MHRYGERNAHHPPGLMMGGRRTREGSMKNTGGSARSRMGQWGEARLHNRSHARRSLHSLVKIRSRSVLHVDFRLRLAVVSGSCRLRQAGTEHDAHQDGCRPGFNTQVHRSGAVKQGWRYERSNWTLPRFTPGSGGVSRFHHQLEEHGEAFQCPAHGSAFIAAGALELGPATTGLPRVASTLKGGPSAGSTSLETSSLYRSLRISRT